MNSKIVIAIFIGIAVIVGISTTFDSQTEPVSDVEYDIDFTYSDADKIKKILSTQDIYMSSSAAISDDTVDQYCTFFDGNVQKFVKYCTTAALVDVNGNPLGNFNMGGTSDVSTMAIALLESKPLIDSNENEVDFVFETMIEMLVCDCWEQQQPGDFESVSVWIDAAEKHYLESGQITLKSKINGIDGKQIVLEITNTGNSYLWTLVVLK